MSGMDTTISVEVRRDLCARFGLSPQYLYQCLTGRRGMRAEDAVRLERDSGGLVTRRHLRPQDWHLIWPELVDADHPAPAGQEAASDASTADV